MWTSTISTRVSPTTSARELTHNPELTEQEMVSRAGEIVALAGIQLRAYAEVQQKFNELLQSFSPSPNLVGTVERARIERTNGQSSEQGDQQGSGDNGGGSNDGENEG